MSDIPLTELEVRASAATNLPSLRINLPAVRSAVEDILNNWKGAGFFTEYTDHSFQHVIGMLKSAEWVIPRETKEILTHAEWLMLVLSIYFHDMGLLITKREYEQRDKNPEYKTFVANSILPSDKQQEYLARLEQMQPEEADRLRYQEFVRHSHGRRVKAWLDGSAIDDLGASKATRKVISGLVEGLDETFRKDLALVCESHTLGNIDDTNIFKVSKPYGGREETVNLQYVAVVLRTVDLLQIERKRAPSVLFQLIDPGNPVSQIEWQKQGAVRTVRPAPARDRDGNVTDAIPSSTVEVHATFKDPDGFFGLTRYLTYAQAELAHSYNAVLKSARDTLKGYKFPWRHIDSSGIDTEGFLTDSFEFELDQHRILDLLTGHTLYNNSTVVIRELTQNALDAVRLQAEIEGVSSDEVGRVDIYWKSADRSLVVMDNGTGMSQDMIVNHLLKVGSSRYQDPSFKEKHPDFHSISRFGIGVLSAFMVSDDVEITTCNEEDEKARRIALRSVHGKYLIKLLDKVADRSELPMYPHGTAVRLVLRPTATVGDVLRVSRSWLMFPRCEVYVHVDDSDPVRVGFSSPKEAIDYYLNSSFRRSRFKAEYDVREHTSGSVTLAYAVSKDELYEDWGFVTVSRHNEREDDEGIVPVATCIEGVAVEQSTPGFLGPHILAIANAVGPAAPRTNVARSALEDTQEQRDMLRRVYGIYAQHISSEVDRLARSKSYSLSRAVGAAPFIAAPLTYSSVSPSKQGILSDALGAVPMVLIEDGEERRSISLQALSASDSFATIESPLYRSIEFFVKEAPADITATKLLTTLGNKISTGSRRPIVCNLQSSIYLEERVREVFEVTEVDASAEARTLTMQWSRRTQVPVWFSNTSVHERLSESDAKFWRVVAEARERLRTSRRWLEPVNVPVRTVRMTGLQNSGVFVSNREQYLTSGSPLVKFLVSIYKGTDLEKFRCLSAYFLLLDYFRANNLTWDMVSSELIERATSQASFRSVLLHATRVPDFLRALQDTPAKVFDVYAWDRRDNSAVDLY